MWVRAGISGYVYCFELYQGASCINYEKSACGEAGDIVPRLTHDLHGQNYKVYADNYFTRLLLVPKLKEQDIWYVGTIRANRLQGADKKLRPVKNKEEGVFLSARPITVTLCIDNSAVHVISSYAGKELESAGQCFSTKEKKYIEVQRPCSIERYNKHNMDGVDLIDSLVVLYRNDVRNRRWKMHLLEFKSRVVTGLIYQGKAEIGKKKRGRPSDESKEPKKKRAGHTVQRTALPRKMH
ncbi:hypothetical protein PR048_032977 [Dryococelus australis]|uniref:PiggyBac transposable element-derived protein domain-containing protein n=1 Tax=Dryococelus australis TaxID=614101 RepID=A0ABQ9G3R2_9NEOP|nr:hypothetical protein PR048_032977 [Dryococelus australis]